MAGSTQRAQKPIGSKRGREGGRWYNERPTSDEIATWFKDVPMHEGMDPARYVGGLTLIESWEHTTEIRENGGNKTPVKVKNLALTPYCKVETRVQYFWDYMAAHPEWVGSIIPVDSPRKHERDGDLPPGFYRVLVKQAEKSYGYVACSMRVTVRERDGKNHRYDQIIDAPPATKLIPILSENWGKVEPDPFALMKAETGAVGRALGLAGMLIVPGAGVATAEDMLEAQAQGPVPEGEVETPSGLPDAVPSRGVEDRSDEEEQPTADPAEALAAEAKEKLAQLEAESPQKHEEFQTWAKGRKLGALETLGQVQLRGIVRRLDKALEG